MSDPNRIRFWTPDVVGTFLGVAVACVVAVPVVLALGFHGTAAFATGAVFGLVGQLVGFILGCRWEDKAAAK